MRQLCLTCVRETGRSDTPLACDFTSVTYGSPLQNGRPIRFTWGIVPVDSFILLSPGTAVHPLPMDDTVLRVAVLVPLRMPQCDELVVPAGSSKRIAS